jgi:hypothetical protein
MRLLIVPIWFYSIRITNSRQNKIILFQVIMKCYFITSVINILKKIQYKSIAKSS